MTIKRRKKNTRMRGSKTHGWGAMKKHRGAGHRGGRGNAGSGKRGDAKKPNYWGDKRYYGKTGFTYRGFTADADVRLNVGNLSSMAQTLLNEGRATQEGKLIVVDLGELGFTRLLGTGIVSFALKVTVPYATEKAIAKIEAAGGQVTVTAPAEEEPVEAVASADE